MLRLLDRLHDDGSGGSDHARPLWPGCLLLAGPRQDGAGVERLPRAVTGDDGASQCGVSHGFCTPMDGESYDACDICDRNHVRLNQTHHKDTLGRYETVGTPHFDQTVWCGAVRKHRAQSYLYTRNYIAGGMSYWYGVSYQNWGNTQPMRQCDGSYTSSDGQVAWVNIG